MAECQVDQLNRELDSLNVATEQLQQDVKQLRADIRDTGNYPCVSLALFCVITHTILTLMIFYLPKIFLSLLSHQDHSSRTAQSNVDELQSQSAILTASYQNSLEHVNVLHEYTARLSNRPIG